MTETQIFIQANQKQLLGAKIAKYALETRGGAKAHNIPVHIIEVEKEDAFKILDGKEYRPGYGTYKHGSDLQTFTLTRFMPPERMGFKGRSLVIDPDIFACSDITTLLSMDMRGAAIAACPKNSAWDTSVMLLDNTKLTHWKIETILSDIANGKRTYDDIITLKTETGPITPLERVWNSLDILTDETKMLHTTVRLTQPWRTGLPIDFTFNPIPKLFGFIPVTVNATANVDANGNVTVSYPWYAFLMSTNRADLETKIQSNVSADAGASAKADAQAAAQFSAEAQARVIAAVKAAMQTELNAEANASASGSANVQ